MLSFLAALMIAAPLPIQEEGEPEAQDEFIFDDGLDELLSGDWIDAEEAASPGGASLLRSWKGFLEFRSKLYTAGNVPGNESEYWIEGELELDFDLAEHLTGFLRPRVRVSLRDSDANEFEPFEGYVSYSGTGWDLRAGQFVENWGIADTFNPIDILNRRDFESDFLDPDRLGELGLRWRKFMEGNQTFGEPTLSLYALPVFRPTPFPSDESRFSFSSLGMTFNEGGGLTPHGSEGALFAVRLLSTLKSRLANADLQLLAARGPEHVPVIALSGGTLVPVYFGTSTIGGGARLVPNSDALGDFLSSLTLKAEVAFKKPYNFDNATIATPSSYLQYVLGVDRLTPNLFMSGDQLTTTIEYIGETGARDTDAAAALRPFRSDFVLRGFWEQNDFSRTSLEARAILDTQLSERVYEFIYEQQLRALHEDLKLICSLQVFNASDTQGLFSALPDNTAGTVTLRFER